jgi:hypothetical protein
MSTDKQHRTNSPESTGPSATQAKAAARYNPLKHGIFAIYQIMFDESAEALADLAAEYHEQYSPANAKQRFLVDTLISNEWRLRRMRRVEAELWEYATNAFLANNSEVPACSSGDSFATGSEQFVHLQRIVNFCERNYHRALKELQAKAGRAPSSADVPADPGPMPQKSEPQAGPEPATAPPEPQQSTPSSAKLASFRQNSKTPPPAAPKTPGVPPSASPVAPANPAETQPSASDCDPKPPEAA